MVTAPHAPAATPRRPPVWNLPNILTLSRLPLALVLFACIELRAWFAALAVFAAAAITDWLDGHLARTRGQTSAFGRTFDPLTDKVLVCGAFIFLLPVPAAGIGAWMVTVVVGREMLITGLRGYLEQQGAAFGADILGKLKMLLQCMVLIGTFLALGLAPGAAWLGRVNLVLLYAMLAATLLSAAQYVVKAWVLLRD
jgi:CDP-diacylglycerol--glycerol-3-phosphate 3-phosphatidyltransferase